MSKTLKIAALGVASTELEQIKQLMAGMRLPTRWEWSPDNVNADVLMIDVDSLYGHMDWLKAHSQGRRIICLSASTMSDKDIVAARPVSVGGLRHALALAAGDDVGESGVSAEQMAALGASSGGARGAAVRVTGEQPAVLLAARRTGEQRAVPTLPRRTGEQPAVGMPITAENPAVATPRITGQQRAVGAAAPAPAPVPQRAASLADYLLGGLLAEAALLARAGVPSLILDPANERYYGGLTLKPLLPYCQGAIKPGEWKPVPAAELERLRASGSGLPLTRLLWLYALGNSNGQSLLAGLDREARFKLLKWPQIEREFPKHFRIATAIMKAPALLTEVAEAAAAPINEVVDFINAYAVVGVVVQDGQPAWTERAQLLEKLHAQAH
ncbi:MAG: hypothetical protein AB7I68_13590 [Porticoccaceae bacterium]